MLQQFSIIAAINLLNCHIQQWTPTENKHYFQWSKPCGKVCEEKCRSQRYKWIRKTLKEVNKIRTCVRIFIHLNYNVWHFAKWIWCTWKPTLVLAEFSKTSSTFYCDRVATSLKHLVQSYHEKIRAQGLRKSTVKFAGSGKNVWFKKSAGKAHSSQQWSLNFLMFFSNTKSDNYHLSSSRGSKK